MSRRFLRRTPAAVTFVALLGILPAAGNALPLREQGAPVLRFQAGDWLSRLGEVAQTLWNKATEEKGIIIDPDGQPTAAPGDEPGSGVERPNS